MPPSQREYVLKLRKSQNLPWHGPSHHYKSNKTRYHITAACYEHRLYIGKTVERMVAFEATLLKNISENGLALKIY